MYILNIFHIKYKNYAINAFNILGIMYEYNCQFENFCIIENPKSLSVCIYTYIHRPIYSLCLRYTHSEKHTTLAFLPMSSLYTSVN